MTIGNPVPGKQRNLLNRAVGGVFSLAFGLVFGAAGVLLGAWSAVAVFRLGLAWDWVVWIVENVPLQWTVTGKELADQMVQRNSRIGSGVAAFVLCWIAVSCLRSARQAFGPSGLSDDGWGRLELESAPRVGAPLKGRIVLTKLGQVGEVFKLSLSCTRRPWATSDGQTTLFASEHEAEVDLEGRYLPVEFLIPDTASETESRMDQYVVEWRFNVYATTGLIAFPSVFDLEVAPQAAADVRAREAAESPREKAEIRAIEQELGALGRSVLPHDRAQLREMTSEQRAQMRAMLEKTGKLSNKIGRFTLGCFVVFIVFVTGMIVLGNVILALK